MGAETGTLNAAAKKYQPRHDGFCSARAVNLYGSRESIEDPVPNDEVRRLCRLMVIALAGFLTAGWFLSRAYSMPIFLFSGMTVALYGMARKRGLVPPPLSLGAAMKASAITSFVLLAIVYVIVRVDHFLPH